MTSLQGTAVVAVVSILLNFFLVWLVVEQGKELEEAAKRVKNSMDAAMLTVGKWRESLDRIHSSQNCTCPNAPLGSTVKCAECYVYQRFLPQPAGPAPQCHLPQEGVCLSDPPTSCAKCMWRLPDPLRRCTGISGYIPITLCDKCSEYSTCDIYALKWRIEEANSKSDPEYFVSDRDALTPT